LILTNAFVCSEFIRDNLLKYETDLH
jgi:hypothetical protein